MPNLALNYCWFDLLGNVKANLWVSLSWFVLLNIQEYVIFISDNIKYKRQVIVTEHLSPVFRPRWAVTAEKAHVASVMVREGHPKLPRSMPDTVQGASLHPARWS
jgi:hypothetical protein